MRGDSGMDREASDLWSDSMKGNPRCCYKATDESLTLAARVRPPPMNRMSCITQHANIRLINRRERLPYSFRYQIFGFTGKEGGKNQKLL
jgi:hypothetical protein